jgi:hypothetical protein
MRTCELLILVRTTRHKISRCRSTSEALSRSCCRTFSMETSLIVAKITCCVNAAGMTVLSPMPLQARDDERINEKTGRPFMQILFPTWLTVKIDCRWVWQKVSFYATRLANRLPVSITRGYAGYPFMRLLLLCILAPVQWNAVGRDFSSSFHS